MSEINLLPEQDRKREQQERARAAHLSEHQEVHLTAGATLANATPAVRGHLLQRLFGRTPSDLTAKAVGEQEHPAGTVLAHEGTPSAQRPSFWKRLFKARSSARSLPPPNVPKQTDFPAPTALSGQGAVSVASENAPIQAPSPLLVVEAHAPPAPPGTLPPKPQRHQRNWNDWKKFLHRSHSTEEKHEKPLMTSLLPREYVRASYHAMAYTKIVTAFSLSIGMIVLSLWFLLGEETVAKAQQDQAKTSIVILDQEIATLQKDKMQAVELQKKLEAAKILLNTHVRWTRALSFLEHTAVSDVQYQSLSVDAEGKFKIKAVGANFSSLARQLTVFQNTPEIKFVSINKGEAQGDTVGVQFDISLEVLPSVFDNR